MTNRNPEDFPRKLPPQTLGEKFSNYLGHFVKWEGYLINVVICFEFIALKFIQYSFLPPWWVFPKIRGTVPQNGWFIMENPIFQWMIWGENPTIFGNILVWTFRSSGNLLRIQVASKAAAEAAAKVGFLSAFLAAERVAEVFENWKIMK